MYFTSWLLFMNMNGQYSYCVKKLAVLETGTQGNTNANFIYKNKKYTKSFNFCENELLSDVAANNDFKISEDYLVNTNNINHENITHLCLIFTPNSYRYREKSYKSRSRLISIFTNHKEFDVQDIVTKSTDNDYTITNSIYQHLIEYHAKEKLSSEIPLNVQHKSLRLTLREYQSKAVRWLLHRELSKEVLWDGFKQIDCPEVPDTIFYLNIHTLVLTDIKPKYIEIPCGGILADEMGLGKTIEILDLILLNPKPNNINNPDLNEIQSIKDNSAKRIKLDHLNVLCICKNLVKSKNLIKCSICGISQHIECTRKYTINKNEPHICPKCWENTEMIASGATVIVTPSSILSQWHSEIQKHLSTPLKVFLYNGVSTSWISPKELSRYDIILTDYNVLKKEFYYSSNNESSRELRTKKKYMRANSPLTMVLWWRVCLDEAQMVESTNMKATKMVQTLSTIYRWAVTGTPIQKSTDDLQGLLDFCNLHPIYEDIYWNSLVSKYNCGDTKLLIDILGKVMWRNCKDNVSNELDIPDQREKIHYIDMNNIEMLFYVGEHSVCKENFNNVVDKFMCHNSQISKINPNLLKTILQPLKKLRQDCTMPVLLQKIQKNIVKRLLKPQELLEHLRTTNEMLCKTQLRTMASNYNGKAGIYIIRGEYTEAIKMYESVLNLARQYKERISVDSLLKIHALHNLLLVHEMNNTISNISDCNKNMLIKLEWQYLEPYYKRMHEADLVYRNSNKSLIQDEDTLFEHICAWVDLLKILESFNCWEQLVVKINNEKDNSFPMLMINTFTHISGIQYVILNWFDKIESIINDKRKCLRPLNDFVLKMDELKCGNRSSTSEISKFVEMASMCHLNILRNENISNPLETEKSECDLCKVKNILNKYECLIFNKSVGEYSKLTEGTWNPSFQEIILKEILNFSKTRAVPMYLTTVCTKTLNYIDSMKKEYKELIKLWIEIEYTVKAYDELDMCKLRLNVIDSSEDKKSIYQISKYELDEYFIRLSYELDVSQLELTQKLARLKYINHLANKGDSEACPICRQEPEGKYTVLQCGHYLCLICFISLSKYQKHWMMLTCPICRNRQKFEDIYYVKVQKPRSQDDIDIIGDYSSKIEKILYIILNLKRQSNDVKIVIFSQWLPILQVICNALKENVIEFRFRCTNKTVNEFKDETLNVTCLVLLLSEGSKGLNLTEATHIIFVEPILNPGDEMQAISRIHRIGQTKETTIHKMIVKDTIEEKIFSTISKDNWKFENLSIENLKALFSLDP